MHVLKIISCLFIPTTAARVATAARLATVAKLPFKVNITDFVVNRQHSGNETKARAVNFKLTTPSGATHGCSDLNPTFPKLVREKLCDNANFGFTLHSGPKNSSFRLRVYHSRSAVFVQITDASVFHVLTASLRSNNIAT